MNDANGIVTEREPSLHERIVAVVATIPHGRVTNYGHVAQLAGAPGAARVVGYALHGLPPGSNVPWHRVVNASGMISLVKLGEIGALQKTLLENEGVEFSSTGKIDLDRFGWWGTEI